MIALGARIANPAPVRTGMSEARSRGWTSVVDHGSSPEESPTPSRAPWRAACRAYPGLYATIMPLPVYPIPVGDARDCRRRNVGDPRKLP